MHLFNKQCLFHIVSCLGNPLFIDAATLSLFWPNVARVCVEVNLLQSLPPRVWVDTGEGAGFWQELQPENVPKYCSHCYHQGHNVDDCRIKHPNLVRQVEKEAAALRMEDARPVHERAGEKDVISGCDDMRGARASAAGAGSDM